MSEYEVGHRRPPREHQFRKGQSGNPRGRPRRALSGGSAVQRELLRTQTVTIRGKQRTMLVADLVIYAVAQRVVAGKAKACEMRWVAKASREIEERRRFEEARLAAQRYEEDRKIIRAFKEDVRREFPELIQKWEDWEKAKGPWPGALDQDKP